MAPWTHLSVSADGRALPCCVADAKKPIGDLTKTPVEEIWNGSKMRSLRRRMLKGEVNSECQVCTVLEDVGMESHRITMNEQFRHHMPLVEKTEPDGSVEKINLPYLDIRFSNLCNFKCRSCNVNASSSWYADTQTLGGRVPDKILQPFASLENFQRQFEPYLEDLEEIYFAGGEPLLNEHHYYILNRLIELKKTNVRLMYNTNFSVFKFKNQSVFDLWKNFKFVRVSASLDGMAERGEYIRKGQNWQQTVQNRTKMKDEVPHVQFEVSCTLGVLNSLHVTDFHREWIEQGFIKPEQFQLNLIVDPLFYQLAALPPELKTAVQEKYDNHIGFLRKFLNTEKIISEYKSAIAFMNKSDMSKKLYDFNRMTGKLDSLRSENFLSVFPELAAIVDRRPSTFFNLKAATQEWIDRVKP